MRSPQLRYVARGTTGTYEKTGIDVQEQQLRAYADPEDIVTDPAYGVEPEIFWGTLENLSSAPGEGEVVRSTYVSFIHRERAVGWLDVMAFLNLSGGAPDICIYRWPTSERGNYSALFVNLAEVIREGKEALVKWQESADVIEVIEAAYQSAREGRTITITGEH